MSHLPVYGRGRAGLQALGGLAVFYGAMLMVAWALVAWQPTLAPLLSLHVATPVALQQAKDALKTGAAEQALPLVVSGAPAWAGVAVAIVGSLLFALPVAWIYTITKRREGYDQSVVQMIVMLPVAVAAVVLVVFGSLSLAFALGGIVAAVRFRTTLKDQRDAVFAFVAIGIGLAAGIQSWLLAGLLSLTFSVLGLLLWVYDVGNARPGFVRRPGPITLAEALAPGGDEVPLRVGDAKLLGALSGAELPTLVPHAERVADEMRADAKRGTGKFRELVLAHTDEPARARAVLDEVLEPYAKRWRVVGEFNSPRGATVLAVLLRLSKKADVGQLLDELLARDEGVIRAVELTSVRPRRRD